MNANQHDTFSTPWWEKVQTEFQLSDAQVGTLQSLLDGQRELAGISDKPKTVQIRNRRAFELIAAKLNRAHKELSELDFAALQYLARDATFSEHEPHFQCDAKTEEVSFHTSPFAGDQEFTKHELLLLISSLAKIASRGAGMKGTPLNEDYSLNAWVHDLAMFWDTTCARRYSRSFQESKPTNPASHFTVKMTQAIDPKITTARIELAMKHVIQAARRRAG